MTALSKYLNTSLDYLLGATNIFQIYFGKTEMYTTLTKFSYLDELKQNFILIYANYLLEQQEKEEVLQKS